MKDNESELGTLMRNLGYHVHKGRDRGYLACPHCHIPVRTCPVCRQDMLLEKAETMADFIISEKWFDAEAKMREFRFSLTDVSPTQIRVLNNSKEAYLFLGLGKGRADRTFPDNREAFLIPWKELVTIMGELEERDIHSVVYRTSSRSTSPQANIVFQPYQLRWSKGGWSIPESHGFWKGRANGVNFSEPGSSNDPYQSKLI